MSRSSSQLRKNLGASASELKDFIASLKGKSPAEAMGLVTGSKLIRAIGISLGVQVIVLLLFTIPFAIFKSDPPPKKKLATPVPAAVAPTTKPATKKANATAQPKDATNNVTKNWDSKEPDQMPTFRDDILKENR